ncbi:MAG TPA: hypothetical protein VN950_01195 [Terriglobales bacterium]|nr:hypothetical protein [Terriglobales bacterium]
MSDTIPTPMTTDLTGTAQPVGASNIPTPATAAPQSDAQPTDNSNAPDASTPAAKSIPAALVNNPQVESQKIAAQVDANKNSPAPFHTMLRNAAIEMLGGPQYRTDYKPDGTAVRTPIEPSLAHLGLALAAEVLKGGMAGGNAKDSVAAAQQGAKVAEQQRAAVKQANIDQDAQAKADQNHKLAVVKNNLETHQLAMNVGKQDMEMNQAYVNSYEPVVNMLENHAGMIKADVPEDQVQAGLKSGKYNVTKDLFIPHGDPVAIMDPQTGKQKEVNGVPVWSHNYYVVDAAAKGQLTQEIQDMGYKIGKFRNPDGSRVVVPADAEYPMATIGRYATEFAQVQTAEEQIERHKDEVLGDNKGPRVSMADSVAQDPSMMRAVQDYSRFVGVGAPDQVLGAMMANGKGASAAKLMDFMGVTPDDIRKAENQRLKEHTEATAEGKAEAFTPDTMGKALAKLNDPNASAAEHKQAQGVVDGFNQQEQTKADNAINKAEAIEQHKQDVRDQRLMGYVEDQNGDVYHVSRWEADHMPNYSAQTFIEKKPSDISADQKAIKPINDIQNNINGYRTANAAYDAAAKSNKVNVAGDRSNLTTIFSAPAITDAAAAHAGVEGFGMTIPTLAADLNKDLAKKVLNAYNALSPEGKTMADSYARMRGAIPAYVKVITNAGRGSKEQLDIELQNIMPPYFNQSDIGHRIETFQGNLDTQKAGFPKNLAGSHFVPTSGANAQTHNFSLSAWQKANPTGDANAAKAAAQKQGLTVVQ